MGRVTTWPLIEDLIAASLTIPIPSTLQEDLSTRYSELGEKYATDRIHPDTGLKINSCMTRDNMQECYEELVDAVFNCLVHMYRFPQNPMGPILLWSLLGACQIISVQRGGYG